MEYSQGKQFEKPQPGMYLGTLIDVVEMPNVQTQYGTKNKVRFHWILAHLNGQPYLGKDGSFIEAVAIYNASVGAKAELPKRLTQIIGQAPPVITSTEQLEQLVLGRSNVLVLVANANPRDPNSPFINVDGIGPVAQGMFPPAVPPTYVRAKNRPKTQAGPNGQPVQTFATPQAAQAAYQQAAPTNPAVAQPLQNNAITAPTPEQIAAYLAAQNAVNMNQPAPPAPGSAPAPAPQGTRPF
jgi:hypothetical protein